MVANLDGRVHALVVHPDRVLRCPALRPTITLEETAMVVYAFDVDETLEVSNGPVKLVDRVKLRERVAECGR
jgi:hypothetical protein